MRGISEDIPGEFRGCGSYRVLEVVAEGRDVEGELLHGRQRAQGPAAAREEEDHLHAPRQSQWVKRRGRATGLSYGAHCWRALPGLWGGPARQQAGPGRSSFGPAAQPGHGQIPQEAARPSGQGVRGPRWEAGPRVRPAATQPCAPHSSRGRAPG